MGFKIIVAAKYKGHGKNREPSAEENFLCVDLLLSLGEWFRGVMQPSEHAASHQAVYCFLLKSLTQITKDVISKFSEG